MQNTYFREYQQSLQKYHLDLQQIYYTSPRMLSYWYPANGDGYYPTNKGVKNAFKILYFNSKCGVCQTNVEDITNVTRK